MRALKSLGVKSSKNLTPRSIAFPSELLATCDSLLLKGLLKSLTIIGLGLSFRFFLVRWVFSISAVAFSKVILLLISEGVDKVEMEVVSGKMAVHHLKNEFLAQFQ